MNPRHTPGPWEIRKSDVYQKNGRHIAYTGPHHTPPDIYPKSCRLADEANARLIAAAPELMEALEECIEEFNSTGMISNESITCAEKAIAKVKGNQP